MELPLWLIFVLEFHYDDTSRHSLERSLQKRISLCFDYGTIITMKGTRGARREAEGGSIVPLTGFLA